MLTPPQFGHPYALTPPHFTYNTPPLQMHTRRGEINSRRDWREWEMRKIRAQIDEKHELLSLATTNVSGWCYCWRCTPPLFTSSLTTALLQLFSHHTPYHAVALSLLRCPTSPMLFCSLFAPTLSHSHSITKIHSFGPYQKNFLFIIQKFWKNRGGREGFFFIFLRTNISTIWRRKMNQQENTHKVTLWS